MKALGLEEHIADPRFASYSSRKQHEDALLALVEPAVCARESREIEFALMAAGLPCASVNNFKEVFDDPHMIARGIVKDVQHPRLGPMRATRNPILLDHDGPSIDRYAPMLGEHSEGVLRELGYSAQKIDEFFSAGVTGSAERKAPGRRPSERRQDAGFAAPNGAVPSSNNRIVVPGPDSSRRPTVMRGPFTVRTLASRCGRQIGLPKHVTNDRDLLDHALGDTVFHEIMAVAAQTRQPLGKITGAARSAAPDADAVTHVMRFQMAAAAVPP